MHRYWEPIIKPLLETINPGLILEIGAEYGKGTSRLIEFCKNSGCRLVSIDPVPLFNASDEAERNAPFFTFHQALSLDALPLVEPADAVLLDGDHNWYTVFNELKLIEEKCSNREHPFPVIILHDIGWPYGRRDLYYNPDNIPEKFRHPYQRKGILPEHNALVDKDGLNSNYCNAVHENGIQNGVRTAVENFMEQSALPLNLTILPGLYGLGLLYTKDHYQKKSKFRKFIDNISISSMTGHVMEIMETDRIQKQLAVTRREDQIQRLDAKIQRIIKDRDEQIQKRIRQIQDRERLVRERDNQIQERDKQIRERDSQVKKQNKTIQELTHQSNHYEQQVKKLTDFLEKFYLDFSAMVNSRRWRMGNKIGDVLRLISLKKLVPTTADSIAANFKQYRLWKTPLPVKKATSNTNSLLQNTMEELLKRQCSNLFSLSMVNKVLCVLSGPPVSIVVPIYNAYEETQNCIFSIMEYTTIPFKLILINDCSTDTRIAPLISAYKNDDRVSIMTNPENKGFVNTVNRGINACKTDVVLLNSDTKVTPRWLQKLIIAAYSDPTIATVTPFSNASGAFSVPEFGKNKKQPPYLTVQASAYRIERAVHPQYPQVPTGNGFCMYVKRKAIQETGIFDEVNFKRGYGEENDFCMRAMKKGWKHIIDDSSFIYHKNSASFSEDKERLIKENRKVLDRLHPDYSDHVRKFAASKQIQTIRDTITTALEKPCTDKRSWSMRILYVMHEGTGGTPATNQDLMQHVSQSHECFLMTCTGKQLMVRHIFKDTAVEIFRCSLKQAWSAAQFESDEFKVLYFSLLVNLKIELVHIRHLFKHCFILPEICQKLGVGVIFSFHDFYHICPSFHLLDHRLRYCSGVCNETKKDQCNVPTQMLSDLPRLPEYLPKWREAVSATLNCCQTFITTCEEAKKLHIKAFPQLKDERFVVIEHGRDFPKTESICATIPNKDDKIKILIPGNIDAHKGSLFIKDLFDFDKKNRIEFHFLGAIPELLENCGVYHGRYDRDNFHKIVSDIQPSFAAIFSIWPETYCHTLSEAWASGLPVLSFNLGAPGERITRHGAGWFLYIDNIKTSFEKILEIAQNPAEYQRTLENVKNIRFKSTLEMAKEYLFEYNNAMLKLTHGQHRHKSILLFTPSGANGFPGSSYIRCLLPLQHSLVAKYYSLEIVPDSINQEDLTAYFDRPEIGCLMIQRDVLVGNQLDNILEKADAKGLPIIYELDDNLMGIGPEHPEYHQYEPKIKSIEKLCNRADLVTVSTPELKKSIARYSSRIELIPNALDETLWLSPSKENEKNTTQQNTLKLGYMGTYTHTKDLEFLKEIIPQAKQILFDEHNISMDFEMIGGLPDKPLSKSWYSRINIPKTNYPEFVAWLRQTVHWDIALAPLENNLLNQCKSELKFLEYTAMGAVGIYSDYGGYANAVVHEKTGFLVKGRSLEKWKTYIIQLALDKKLRQQMLMEAEQTLYQNYLLKQRSRAWKNALDRVTKHNMRE